MNIEELKEEIEIRLLEWKINQLKFEKQLREWSRLKKLLKG